MNRASFAALWVTGLVLELILLAIDSTGVLTLILALVLLVPNVMTAIKRLHDLGWTGWLTLLYLVPLVNFVMLVICLALPSAAAGDKYGRAPAPGIAY